MRRSLSLRNDDAVLVLRPRCDRLPLSADVESVAWCAVKRIQSPLLRGLPTITSLVRWTVFNGVVWRAFLAFAITVGQIVRAVTY